MKLTVHLGCISMHSSLRIALKSPPKFSQIRFFKRLYWLLLITDPIQSGVEKIRARLLAKGGGIKYCVRDYDFEVLAARVAEAINTSH